MELNLKNTFINDDCIKLIAQSKMFANLKNLNISQCNCITYKSLTNLYST